MDVRKLKPETIAHFGVGYASRGIMKVTIAVPVHDDDSELEEEDARLEELLCASSAAGAVRRRNAKRLGS